MIVPARKTYKVASEKSIPMKTRDGITLYADVVRPDAPGRFPVLLSRTPYNKKGSRNNLDSIGLRDILPNEIVKVDLIYEDLPGNGDVKKTPLELWAGFVGLKQNDKTYDLKPEIGWMIRKKIKVAGDLVSELKSQNNGGEYPDRGVSIRVKTVPEELFDIGPIHSLTIEFTDEINIPDEMGKIKIDKLDISGKIKFEDRERISKLFPHTILYINNQQIVDGKPVQY